MYSIVMARALCRPEIENANDVPMRDLPREDQLLFEALQDLRIARQLGAYDLDGNQAVEFLASCPINRAHAALAKQLQNLVAVAARIIRASPPALALKEVGRAQDVIGVANWILPVVLSRHICPVESEI